MDSKLDPQKFAKKDLYKLFALSPSSTNDEITKAYRRFARKVHPDKNPDDPLAAEKFREFTEAWEILTDEAARKAYDNLQRAKCALRERDEKLDATRKKFKLDLEERERKAAETRATVVGAGTEARTAEEEFAKQLERLRRENARLLERERELFEQELSSSHKNVPAAASARTSLFPNSSSPAQSAASATSYSDDFEALVLSRMRAAAAARSTAAAPELSAAATTVSASRRPDRSEHIDLTGADAERSRPAADDSTQSTDACTKPHNKVVVLD